MPIVWAVFDDHVDSPALGPIVNYFRNHVFGDLFWNVMVGRLKILVAAFRICRPQYVYKEVYGKHVGIVPYIYDVAQIWLFKLDEHMRSAMQLPPEVVSENLQFQLEMVLAVQRAPIHF